MSKSSKKTGCAIEVAIGLIGGRWKGIILFHLLVGKRRFGELQRLLPKATARTLTLQLRELEAHGLISRTIHPVVPPHVEYSLTEFGETLEPILLSLVAWGKKYEVRLALQPRS